MIHDPDLLDQLDALPKEAFDGEAFRGTRQNLDPLASSFSGGRWMRRDGAGVLYTSLAREGALAGWRQLPWPVDDNYLGRSRLTPGRSGVRG
jgi:hypothetical protein